MKTLQALDADGFEDCKFKAETTGNMKKLMECVGHIQSTRKHIYFAFIRFIKSK